MSTSETPTSLPAQVSPPEFALSATAPHAFLGAEVVALPVLPGGGGREDGTEGDRGVLIGPGAEELSSLVGTDLLALLEMHGSTGTAGEVVSLPVPGGVPGNTALRWVLLVGVGDQRPADFRRAGAALAREARNRDSVATSVAALATADGLEAFVVGAMLGSFALPLALARRPSRCRCAGSCSPACPSPRRSRPRWSGVSRSAAPAGGPGCSPPSRRT